MTGLEIMWDRHNTNHIPGQEQTCPAMDLKKAVGLTMLYVMSPASCVASTPH